MAKFRLELYLDGYDTEEEMIVAAKEYIYYQLNSAGSGISDIEHLPETDEQFLKKLVRSGMRKAVEAYHKLGYGCKTDLDPAIKEAFDLLDEGILDLKQSLGYERNGDWRKKESVNESAS